MRDIWYQHLTLGSAVLVLVASSTTRQRMSIYLVSNGMPPLLVSSSEGQAYPMRICEGLTRWQSW